MMYKYTPICMYVHIHIFINASTHTHTFAVALPHPDAPLASTALVEKSIINNPPCKHWKFFTIVLDIHRDV